MKLIFRICGLVALLGFAITLIAVARADCKGDCKSIFMRDRNVCNEAYRSNNDVTKYKDCLERAKTTFDNCLAACQ
jgi:hypothetical protein